MSKIAGEDSNELAERLRHKADDYSAMLEKPGFRPSRGMLEDCRNEMRKAADALTHPASTALVEATSPQSTVDAVAVIERCALAVEVMQAWETSESGSMYPAEAPFNNGEYIDRSRAADTIRALKAKSPSSDGN